MLATKDDPLADVSFFDLDASRVVSSNGKAAASNGLAVLETDDALSRVRRRRAAASYGRRPSA
jgi:hypothetical protein